jgi:ADP-dependent NAD(P)H-hydrate dehydratase / NAD(P)H-hydrate epimerase
MTVLVTPDEMRAAEAAAVAAGRPEPDLMRDAATQIAAWIDTNVKRRANARRFAVALVGPGNNGGDALVALAFLIERGWRATAVLLGRNQFGTLPAPRDLLDQIDSESIDALAGADVIIDGVYGVGGRASLPEPVAAAFRRARDHRIESGTPLVAIDVPSGVDPGTGKSAPDAFPADVTLCVGLGKIGLVKEPAASNVGELIIVDIGIAPPAAGNHPQLIDQRLVRELLPRRRASAHKHDTGTVLVIGGAPTYFGAPRLSAEAAARAGAGLVCVAAPEAVTRVIAGQVPELVLLPLDDSADRAATQIREWIDRRGGHVDTYVIGPGLGQTPHARELLERLLADDSSPLVAPGQGSSVPTFVLDADALNWIAGRGALPDAFPVARAVLTPHAGELGRLMHERREELLADPIRHASEAANRFKQTVIFKTGYSVAATAEEPTRLSPRAAPELATAGTGDVLAGLIGGLLAQGLSPHPAATVALYVGSRAGQAARARRGVYGVLAHDVIDAIPGVMRDLVEPVWSSDE